MDKKLYIACLKENFEFLDFWEKQGPPAREAVKIVDHYYSTGGSPDPGTWGKNVLMAMDDMQAFINGAHRFGIGTGHYNFWRHGLNSLDPANKEPLPDHLSLVFLEARDPAIFQVETDRDEPFEASATIPLRSKMEGRNTLKASERLLVVDLSKKKGGILNDFKKFLDQVYENRTREDIPESWKAHYTLWTPDTSRERAEAWEQLKIWRMRKERIPFSEIARGLKITEDAAKKAFYRAYERTQRRAYEPDKYRQDGQKINTWDLTKTCQTCPDKKKCNETVELCPEILRFVDQDDTGRKESLSIY